MEYRLNEELSIPVQFHVTIEQKKDVWWRNHSIEQDHRGVKRVTRPMLGFKSFDAAQDTLVGIELMRGCTVKCVTGYLQ